MMVGSMIKQKVKHRTISKFLLFHQKSKFRFVASHQKCKIMETAVNLLCSLVYGPEAVIYQAQQYVCCLLLKNNHNLLKNESGNLGNRPSPTPYAPATAEASQELLELLELYDGVVVQLRGWLLVLTAGLLTAAALNTSAARRGAGTSGESTRRGLREDYSTGQ